MLNPLVLWELLGAPGSRALLEPGVHLPPLTVTPLSPRQLNNMGTGALERVLLPPWAIYSLRGAGGGHSPGAWGRGIMGWSS